jgi:hypothetical protein
MPVVVNVCPLKEYEAGAQMVAFKAVALVSMMVTVCKAESDGQPPLPCILYLMTTVPADMGLSTPVDALTVAIEVLLLLQTPPVDDTE